MKRSEQGAGVAVRAVERWIVQVATGRATMSQRSMAVLARRGITLSTVRRIAKAHNVHVVQLTDDAGHALLAASRSPFRVIC
jgi:hypothetical protein